MTDDRLLERAARSWIERGPTEAPDRAVDAALLRIETTPQQRDLWIPWRPTTMTARIVTAAMVAALAVGGTLAVVSLTSGPAEPNGGCPPTLSEANAIDTSDPSLSPAEREWGIAGGAPGSVRPGRIAAFAWDGDPYSAPLSVITIDPVTGAHCRLVSFVEWKPVSNHYTPLDWSPSGDALAMGIMTPEGSDENFGAQLLIWTPSRLFRVWSGPGEFPSFEWAPDGRSIAVWMPSGDQPINARIIFADGSPDRIFDVKPYATYLKWSPDGSRWIVANVRGVYNPTSFSPSVATVDLADGRVTPIDLGISSLQPIGWFDNDRAILLDRAAKRYLDVPVASPERFSVVPVPEDAFHTDGFVAFSPDRRRVAYLTDVLDGIGGGGVDIADIAGGSPGTPIHVDVGVEGILDVAWAPDGSHLVFTTWTLSSGRSLAIRTWVVNADGTDLRQISAGNVDAAGDPWQPVPVR